MSNQLEKALAIAAGNRDETLNLLKEFVSIPSISTDPKAVDDINFAAQWVAEHLKKLDFNKVGIHETPRHPVVFGEWLEAGANKPTILFYGHYDVQPPEPLELWESPPFSPTLREENLYGRGASDMKGQIIVGLKAIEAIKTIRDLPVNIKFLIEGEEEIGSPNLDEFIKNHKELLACDFAVNLDGGMIGPDIPTITYGLRGLAYFEIRLFGPDHDLHSGIYGGIVHNPAQVMCELIAGMHDEEGRITLPGYYDNVVPMDDAERSDLSKLPMDEAFYLKQTGASKLFGEAGYSPIERVGGRPTLEVNGLLSGFTGKGSKTVLPAQAMAKLSMRLVPDQDPQMVEKQLIQYLEENAPDTVRFEVDNLAGNKASITDRDTPGVEALSKAMEETWGKKPVYRREGGSVPVVTQMQEILGIDSVLTGFGLPDDNLHGPNEKIHLPTFFNGINTLIRYLDILGSLENIKQEV